ncbi:RluA family pseudouridine synthase [Vagococcus coleopterorum]|uniref:Pseudouridine synthase n=1 Tax=Vagococcus coleopterorum TaxID=2714946 RepID=A0A6G8AL63_9ENTE|nr:RluA family pseudouridine synthase [Vagococcus coleopterorum]QIL45727.1 RluA family pseudouridine synthase [Vagococcus coleopterorum]
MEFSWTYQETEPQAIKYFLRRQGVSRGLLAKVKFQGGKIKVNQQVENVLYKLKQDDVLTIDIPAEAEHETLVPDETPIDVVFEDDHYLIVNKPIGVASIPAQYHPRGTMCHRVKHYILNQGYENLVVHVVTRLDRDTSGLMLFAKHGFAHAMMDQELREKKLVKKYQALVSGQVSELSEHSEINLGIERDLTSLVKRQTTETGGLVSRTEYWLNQRVEDLALVDIRLHTGRTHQIRVHFAAVGCPLLGDDLYGGDLERGITRQALHCGELNFTHPFTKEEICCQLPIPEDMEQVIEQTITERGH